MSKPILERISFANGRWHGILRGVPQDSAPIVWVALDGQRISDIIPTPTGSGSEWNVVYDIGSDALNEGILTLHFGIDGNNDILSSFVVFVGDASTDHLLAEVKLLRAELDFLKRSFRKYVVDAER